MGAVQQSFEQFVCDLGLAPVRQKFLRRLRFAEKIALNFVETGAARMAQQRTADPERLAADLAELCLDSTVRDSMRSALARWHYPRAASDLAKNILESAGFPELAALPSLQDKPAGLPE